MEPTPQLIAQLRRDKIDAAQRMSPEQKLLAGPELFDGGVEIAAADIRMQNPDADDNRVRELLQQRLELLHRKDRR